MPAEPARDEQARQVAELFEQHRAAVYAYIARMTRDAALAEEITQDAFLRVYAARERLPQVANERAWVFRIATNVCLTALKRRRRFRWLPWESSDAARATSGDFQEHVLRRDAVERALAALSEEYRAPLLLFSLHGFRVAEVAEILGISEGAVKTRIYRAKEMFLAAYRQDGET